MAAALEIWWRYAVDCLAFFLGLAGKTEKPALPESQRNGAVFVTLRKDGQLRGCIGTLDAYRPLWEDVYSNTFSAAFHDPRFPAVEAGEWKHLSLEVSLLSRSIPLEIPPKERLAWLSHKKPGVILEWSGKRATFLPQVWHELPDAKVFLEHLCSKAHLAPGAWMYPESRLWIYTVEAYEAKTPKATSPDNR